MSQRGNGQPSYYRSAHSFNPAESGWTYEGANNQSRVEYWRRDGVKMDFYPTTNTVKTSMNHPKQGPTQMFRRDLNEREFQAVAENPRTHTGKGYQLKN